MGCSKFHLWNWLRKKSKQVRKIIHMCWGLNSHCFPMVGMVINLIVGVYMPIIRMPYWRWDDHPQYKEFRLWHIYYSCLIRAFIREVKIKRPILGIKKKSYFCLFRNLKIKKKPYPSPRIKSHLSGQIMIFHQTYKIPDNALKLHSRTTTYCTTIIYLYIYIYEVRSGKLTYPVAMENGPWMKMTVSPIKNGDFPGSHVRKYRRVVKCISSMTTSTFIIILPDPFDALSEGIPPGK